MAAMSWGLVLDWERCPDGVELRLEIPDDPTSATFRASTSRREKARLRIANLEDPLIVRFINARDDKRRLAFFGEYGLLRAVETGIASDSVNAVQKRLRLLLDAAGSGDPIKARGAVDRTFAGAQLKPSIEVVEHDTKRLGLMLQPDGLFGFMQLEAAMAAINGARFATCRHCGNVFLTGALTGRRDTAQYCTPTHRVAAARAKRKG